jgi:chromosome segregation ATPase
MPKQAKAKSTLSEITAKQKSDFARFDEVLRELVESGESPTYEHYMFASQLGIDAPAFKAQLRRMNRVVSFQQVAGSAKDRTELLAAADDAEKLLATDGEKLLEQIATLQKQYDSMESKAKQLRRRHEQATNAVDELKGLVPDLVKQEYSLRKRMLQESLGREIKDRETRAKYLEMLLNQQDYTDQSWLETVRLNNHEFVGFSGDRVQRRILLPAFEQARPKLRQELTEIKSELKELQNQFDAERKSMDESLEVYSK